MADDIRKKMDSMTGHLVRQGVAPEKAQQLSRDAAIRADRKASGEKAWRKPYGSND